MWKNIKFSRCVVAALGSVILAFGLLLACIYGLRRKKEFGLTPKQFQKNIKSKV